MGWRAHNESVFVSSHPRVEMPATINETFPDGYTQAHAFIPNATQKWKVYRASARVCATTRRCRRHRLLCRFRVLRRRGRGERKKNRYWNTPSGVITYDTAVHTHNTLYTRFNRSNRRNPTNGCGDPLANTKHIDSQHVNEAGNACIKLLLLCRCVMWIMDKVIVFDSTDFDVGTLWLRRYFIYIFSLHFDRSRVGPKPTLFAISPRNATKEKKREKTRTHAHNVEMAVRLLGLYWYGSILHCWPRKLLATENRQHYKCIRCADHRTGKISIRSHRSILVGQRNSFGKCEWVHRKPNGRFYCGDAAAAAVVGSVDAAINIQSTHNGRHTMAHSCDGMAKQNKNFIRVFGICGNARWSSVHRSSAESDQCWH